MSGSHRKYANVLLYYHNPAVLVHHFGVLALECVAALVSADRYLVAGVKGEVELSYNLTVDLDAASLKRSLYLVAALLNVV